MGVLSEGYENSLLKTLARAANGSRGKRQAKAFPVPAMRPRPKYPFAESAFPQIALF